MKGSFMTKFKFTNLDDEGKFVLINVDDYNYSLMYDLLQLKIIKPKAGKKYKGFEFSDEVAAFFNSMGYTSPLQVITDLKKNGLIVPKQYAMIFKMQFL